jgi:hypothetical protein
MRGEEDRGHGDPVSARLARWYLLGGKPGEFQDLRREFGRHIPSNPVRAAAEARQEIAAVLLANGNGCGGLMGLAALAKEAVAPSRRPEGEFVTVDLTGASDSFDLEAPETASPIEVLCDVPFLRPQTASALTVRHPRIVVPADAAGAGYVHLLLAGSYAKRIWRDARLGTLHIVYSAGPQDAVPLWLGYNFRNDNVTDPQCVGEATSPWGCARCRAASTLRTGRRMRKTC